MSLVVAARLLPLSHWGSHGPGGTYPTGPVTRTFLGVEREGVFFQDIGITSLKT